MGSVKYAVLVQKQGLLLVEIYCDITTALGRHLDQIITALWSRCGGQPTSTRR